MKTMKHRADIMATYEGSGLSPQEAIRKLKAEHPEYFPKHRDAKGEPKTFEAAISGYIREGLRPDVAVRAATTMHPKFQQEYYDRLNIGAAVDLGWILEGHPV